MDEIAIYFAMLCHSPPVGGKKRTMDMSFKVLECVQFLAKSWKIFQGGCFGKHVVRECIWKKGKPNLDLVLIANEYLDGKICSGTLRWFVTGYWKWLWSCEMWVLNVWLEGLGLMRNGIGFVFLSSDFIGS